MKEITFESLRWFDRPARIRIFSNGGQPDVHLSITAPMHVKGLCIGRPVEELPRILTILAPAHHLASAKALDNLFGVKPPQTAEYMREVLLQNMFFLHHLRQIYFLFFSWINPTLSHGVSTSSLHGLDSATHILDDMMRHMALAQESFMLIGGKNDHPVSAVAGGMTRILKPEHCERLARIAQACFDFSLRLGSFFRDKVLGQDKALFEISEIAINSAVGMVYDTVEDEILLRDKNNDHEQRLSPEKFLQKMGLYQASWSMEPMAFVQDSSDKRFPEKIADMDLKNIFLTGPLARLNRGQELSPEAEKERRRLLETIGPLPHFNVLSAFWSILIELISASEKMVAICTPENIVGENIRNISSHMATEGRTAFESPSGIIYHQYHVDEKGIVKDINVVDTTVINNLVRHFFIQKTAEKYIAAESPAKKMKQAIERVLLAF